MKLLLFFSVLAEARDVRQQLIVRADGRMNQASGKLDENRGWVQENLTGKGPEKAKETPSPVPAPPDAGTTVDTADTTEPDDTLEDACAGQMCPMDLCQDGRGRRPIGGDCCACPKVAMCECCGKFGAPHPEHGCPLCKCAAPDQGSCAADGEFPCADVCGNAKPGVKCWTAAVKDTKEGQCKCGARPTKPEVEIPSGPKIVGVGERCNGSLPPQYQVRCDAGLECRHTPHPSGLFKAGASGVCAPVGEAATADEDACAGQMCPMDLCQDGRGRRPIGGDCCACPKVAMCECCGKFGAPHPEHGCPLCKCAAPDQVVEDCDGKGTGWSSCASVCAPGRTPSQQCWTASVKSTAAGQCKCQQLVGI